MIKNNLKFNILNIPTIEEDLEAVILEIVNVTPIITVIACYNPPSKTLDFHKWNSALGNLLNKDNLIILSDFNAKHTAWNCNKTNASGNILHKLIGTNDLTLHNADGISRIGQHNQMDSNIDLIISSTYLSHLITVRQHEDPLSSDHLPLEVIISLEKLTYFHKTNRISTVRTDWTKYHTLLDSQWNFFLSPEFSNLQLEDRYETFVTQMKQAIYESTPSKKTNNSKYPQPSPWWDAHCAKAVRLRKVAFKKWRHTLNFTDWAAYKKQTAVTKKLSKKKKVAPFRSFVESLNEHTSISYFWKKVKNFKNKWTSEPPKIVNTAEQQNAIKDAIGKISPPWVAEKDYQITTTVQDDFLDSPFNLLELNYVIDTTRNKSAPGPDNIEYNMLKFLPVNCTLILLDIFNEFYETEHIPNS
ncbi:uncharacterized protein LOC114881690 [Osmia bicornis bicornis]|uniref:uncharacterized protein LOC114881690 n=1 Tax=Osmia bicornis bicornis TaxID=1437191 RepID=UPI0010F4C308|nr:uncharacterized protein LOC114881690 [Osmia bicornis bicornis]